MNCDVEGSSGSMTWGCTPATPGTEEIFLIVAAGRRPPAVKPAPIPIPRPATEIWPRTKRSPPSMKRTMRSLMAPSVTRPATPIAIPAIANAYPRRILSTPRLVRSGSQTRLACGCGSYAPVHRLASPAAAARTLRFTDSPRLRLRLVRSGSQTRLACGCGSYAPVHRLASPAAAARTLRFTDSPRLRLRLVRSGSQTRLACGCGSYAPVHRLASPAAAARTVRFADLPRLRLRLVRCGSQTRLACGCGSYYHSNRDATGWPARRRTQTFTRAIENRIASDARVRHDMRRKAPPESTLNTASSMPKAVLGWRKSSRNAGS